MNVLQLQRLLRKLKADGLSGGTYFIRPVGNHGIAP